MVMVFTLVSCVQDKLGEVLENFKKEKEEEIRRKEEQLKREEEVVKVHHIILSHTSTASIATMDFSGGSRIS